MPDTAQPPLLWRDPVDSAAQAGNAETARRIDALIKEGRREEVVAALEHWTPAAVLACFTQIRTKRAQTLLTWMSDDLSLRLLSELDPKFHGVLFEEATRAKFTKLLGRLSADDAKRLLLSLPRDYALDIVDAHPDAAELRAVLDVADTAEAAMKRGAVVIREGATIRDVIEDIRARSDRIERIDSLHVIDAAGRLKGYLKLRDLILNHRETPVAEAMRSDPLTVRRDLDREEVLALAQARRETVIAVINDDGVLLGAITPKELAEIARREAEEDMLLMANVSPESTGFDTPLQIVRRRLPWLLTGLAGALLTALVVGSYEETLSRAAILASFIPVVSATAGNAAMQASTISIQAISAGGPLRAGFFGRLGREVLGAAINGTLMGIGIAVLLLAASLFVPIERVEPLMATVALSQLAVILMAGTVGTVTPVVLKALRFDPAVATGIFILTVNDVFGVLILFAFALAIYL